MEIYKVLHFILILDKTSALDNFFAMVKLMPEIFFYGLVAICRVLLVMIGPSTVNHRLFQQITIKS